MSNRAGQNTQLTTTTNTLAPTDTTAPTPSGPQPVGGSTLGGTEAAFSAGLGAPVNSDTWSTTVGGQPAYVSITTQPGTDGTARAAIVTIMPQSASQIWDLATLSTYAVRFVPLDATTAGTEAGPKGQTAHDLHSDRLAASFPAALFTNESESRQVQPGTLYWSCFLASAQASSGVDACWISVGTYN